MKEFSCILFIGSVFYFYFYFTNFSKNRTKHSSFIIFRYDKLTDEKSSLKSRFVTTYASFIHVFRSKFMNDAKRILPISVNISRYFDVFAIRVGGANFETSSLPSLEAVAYVLDHRALRGTDFFRRQRSIFSDEHNSQNKHRYNPKLN